MSSQRPATIFATLVNMLGGSLTADLEPDGPGCSCKSCQRAWRRRRPSLAAMARRDVRLGLLRHRSVGS